MSELIVAEVIVACHMPTYFTSERNNSEPVNVLGATKGKKILKLKILKHCTVYLDFFTACGEKKSNK